MCLLAGRGCLWVGAGRRASSSAAAPTPSAPPQHPPAATVLLKLQVDVPVNMHAPSRFNPPLTGTGEDQAARRLGDVICAQGRAAGRATAFKCGCCGGGGGRQHTSSSHSSAPLTLPAAPDQAPELAFVAGGVDGGQPGRENDGADGGQPKQGGLEGTAAGRHGGWWLERASGSGGGGWEVWGA